jgi:hypothetical protein
LGQARVETATSKFESKSPKLLKATGWVLNDRTGKWVSNANVLDDKICTGNCINMNSWGSFKWMQFATIKHDNKKYYVLLIEEATGSYVGPFNNEWKKL